MWLETFYFRDQVSFTCELVSYSYAENIIFMLAKFSLFVSYNLENQCAANMQNVPGQSNTSNQKQSTSWLIMRITEILKANSYYPISNVLKDLSEFNLKLSYTQCIDQMLPLLIHLMSDKCKQQIIYIDFLRERRTDPVDDKLSSGCS